MDASCKHVWFRNIDSHPARKPEGSEPTLITPGAHSSCPCQGQASAPREVIDGRVRPCTTEYSTTRGTLNTLGGLWLTGLITRYSFLVFLGNCAGVFCFFLYISLRFLSMITDRAGFSGLWVGLAQSVPNWECVFGPWLL